MKQFIALFLPVLLISNNVLAENKITVNMATIADVAIYPERSAPATVISLNESTISARITAQVEELPVRVGDIVEAGSTLAKLDCSDYKLASRESRSRIEALNAQIELAKRRLERTKKLTLKQSISEEILDERESDLAVLNADIRGAKADLEMAIVNESRCIVSSPFRALVVERSSAVGQFTNIGTALVKIMDIEQLELSAQAFTQDTEQISNSNDLVFEHAGKRYPVELRTVIPAINTETRNREVRLLFKNGTALPGAAGKLLWRDTRAHIPGEFLVRRNGELGVFSIKNNVAHFISIPTAQAGRASPTTLPIETPLVIEGHFSLKEADNVSVTN
ncbi:MAG: efflux RND transporter periplasmic adaptor subunit [Proteobacteria bacterium]|nr:efflux RND transporter periplasmic adaptor subunit [Pseudomonadota bacterium]NOG61202.1 efflux RND transporter periplasmic adaptor subunit [Pseudomonadota bacterium]